MQFDTMYIVNEDKNIRQNIKIKPFKLDDLPKFVTNITELIEFFGYYTRVVKIFPEVNGIDIYIKKE